MINVGLAIQIRIVTLLAAVICSGQFVMAQDSASADIPTIDPVLGSYIEMLEDPSYANRESASRRLLETSLDRAVLLDLVRRPGLSGEQQHRLLWIFRQQLLQTPRGAVGIRMVQDANMRVARKGVRSTLPVVIAELLPGLPAERVLEVGDEITHLNGRPLDSPQQLIMDVQTRAPGDVVHLTIQRTVYDENGRERRDENRNVVTEAMEIDLELGNADLLIDERTGLPQRGGPVDVRRAQEATDVVRRLGPAPRQLSVRGTTELDMLDEPDDLEVLAERHVAVRTILAERRAVDDGRIMLSPQLIDRWRVQLDNLRATLREPDLSDIERVYMRHVIDRYEELMDQ